MEEFYEVEPTLENYWRSIILFGRNVASYKFALAKALYDLKASPNDLITLEELAKAFVKHLLEHLEHSPKQITSQSSRFLKACQQYSQNEISYDRLLDQTVKLGFQNVIDAFHNVHSKEISKRFFIDERNTSKGIRITDNLYQLAEMNKFSDLNLETESRWRLVETGWKLGISRQLINVSYDDETQELFIEDNDRRINITSSRESLNGYQKGRCFYCYDDISIDSNDENLADIDHFFPWVLKDIIPNINGVWNLVLACKSCNRGEFGKFDRLPSLNLLERLDKRNEYLIGSHLPLRETLLQQTGKNAKKRHNFLQSQYNTGKINIIHTWEPLTIRGIITF
ncbi:MAG: HNH endonuclease [Sulfurovum sp.]|nr:HNH endonuclease [Sulfurovum sp.]